MIPVVYAATSNPGKLRDFAVAAREDGIRIEPLPALNTISPPHEDQPTFEGNARLKAEYYSRFTSEPVLADDSGLEVDALHGEPGVRSARFAADASWQPPPAPHSASPLTRVSSPLPTDVRNNLYLLERLRGTTRRTARYHCVLALARSGAVLLTADGSVEGEILTAPRGNGGFGYDPLFWLPALQHTMAEISLGEKHSLSHRGRAFRALLPQLRTLLHSPE